MINLGLSAADRAAFEATLRQSHRIRTIVMVRDGNESPVYSFDGAILSGSVNVDWSQASGHPKGHRNPFAAPQGPVRTLDLTVLRPDRNLAFLPGTGGNDLVWAHNFISVDYGVWVDGLSGGPDWVDVPVFWGPITAMEDMGDQLQITASGKEILGLAPCLMWDTLHIPRGTKRTDAIRQLMAKQGEGRFLLPETTEKLRQHLHLNRYTQPWKQAQKIAYDGNAQVFYDGRGRVKYRFWSHNPKWHFNDGQNGCVLSRPQVSYDISAVRNTVEVIGGVPAKKKTAIRAVSHADPWHPLSPQALARNGQRRWMVESVSSSVTKQAHAQEIADSELTKLLNAAVNVTFDSLVIPHLEEGDTVAVSVDGQMLHFVLEQFTLPLTADSNMTVGENRRVSYRKRSKHGSRRPVYLMGSGA